MSYCVIVQLYSFSHNESLQQWVGRGRWLPLSCSCHHCSLVPWVTLSCGRLFWTSPHMVQCSQLTQLCQLQQAGWPQHFQPQHFPPPQLFHAALPDQVCQGTGLLLACWWGNAHPSVCYHEVVSPSTVVLCGSYNVRGTEVNWIHSLWKHGVMLSAYAKLQFQLLYCPIFVDVGCNMR